jgi:hypothetical protein
MCQASEGYRLGPVLHALGEMNSHLLVTGKLSRSSELQAGSGGMYFLKNQKKQV